MIILALLASAAAYDAVPQQSLDGVAIGCKKRDIPEPVCRCMIGKMSATSERRLILDMMGTSEVASDAASLRAVVARHPGVSPQVAQTNAGPAAMQAVRECMTPKR